MPVLAALQPMASTSSPPGSPRGDRDGAGSGSGSTTVSATSSPGLDDEPEQSRIHTMNQSMEMSPRKKPRKQQLTSVEVTDLRCGDGEMQFIVEEKKRIKDEPQSRGCAERRPMSNVQQQQQDERVTGSAPGIGRGRPTPSLLGEFLAILLSCNILPQSRNVVR